VCPFPPSRNEAAAHSGKQKHVQRFLARQPIFNSARAMYGYELLFRSGPENRYDGTAPDLASASTIDRIVRFGMDRLWLPDAARFRIVRAIF
jgi:hypothetical protein